jgi:DNA excision repair protein ERCC-4
MQLCNDLIGIKREALQGALISLTLKFNLPVLRSATQKETAWLMMAAAGQCDVTRRPKNKSHSRPAPAKRKNTAQQQLFILQGLPGIGPGRAENLLEKFGSLKAVFSADVEELRITDGIGSKTAEKLWEVMNLKG